MKTETKNEGTVFKIRPAGRHILTIGRDLIKDNNTALVELVKNAFDADAEHVSIDFSTSQEEKKPGIKIAVRDDGHGMSYDTVTTVWMVPSTVNKLEKPLSETKHRSVQGRKGIGRYAASVLGDELYLETTRSRKMTTLFLDWREFEKKEYLDDVDVLIENKETGKPAGTSIEIAGDNQKLLEWDEDQISNLIKELKRLLSPVQKEVKSDFEVVLNFNSFPVNGYQNRSIVIEPYPILDLFDYRISGSVSGSGEAVLKFENEAIKGVHSEAIKTKIALERGDYCGNLQIDFRIYDKDTESIDHLIERGLKDPESGQKLSRQEARNLLTEVNGIAVYRSGFRIRPHGDPGYDWLQLDRARVQNPGQRVGSDRVSGFVEIEPEEKSHLEEKANREGLKENKFYSGLVEIANKVLLEAENRRYQFKLNTGKQRSQKNLTGKLDKLFDFSDITKSINKELTEHDVPKREREKIIGFIDAKAEEGNKVIEDVKEIIAIYQGQATLGKVVKVVLHEGRNPLGYFQNELPLMQGWIKKLKEKFSRKLLDQLVDRLDGIRRQSETLVSIFNKINPLAAKRRARPIRFQIKKIISNSIDIFAHELRASKIKVRLDCDDEIRIVAWPEDVSQALVNLLDNSLYWLLQQKKKAREIVITVSTMGELVRIKYEDNGPGIEEKFIRDELIFEPGFTTKPGGTGLGLAIAGEAVERNRGKLKAVYSGSGARFLIELPITSDK